MSSTLRWVCVLLPTTPGLILLLAAFVQTIVARDPSDAWRVRSLYTAGGAVLLAGLGIGAFISWRISHPRPDDDPEKAKGPPHYIDPKMGEE